MQGLRENAHEGVPAARANTSAQLAFLVWSHRLWLTMGADAHDGGGAHGH